jgi:uncharacterized protein YeaO (DUF488 family)
MKVHIKRIYDAPKRTDGYRVLVDRLWPRGVSKQKADVDAWLKELAPSPRLRVWFGHKAERFDEFAKRYQAELAESMPFAELKKGAKGKKTVTLLYAARDPQVNHARVLADFIRRKKLL